MAIENRNLEPGTRLVANYKKQPYLCTVEKEGETLAYVLEDASKHKSPSSAAMKVMAGKAVNGWLFWSLAGVEATQRPETAKLASVVNGKLIRRLPNQKGIEGGKVRFWCNACMKSFIDEAGETPTKCPAGHGADGEEG